MASSLVQLVVSIQSVGREASPQILMNLRNSRFFASRTRERGLSVFAVRDVLRVLSNLFFAIAQDFFRILCGAAVPRIVVFRNSSSGVTQFVQQNCYLRFNRATSKESDSQHMISVKPSGCSSGIHHEDWGIRFKERSVGI